MRKLAFVLLGATVLWPLGILPAGAVICAVDAVPAATLLLPYFEVDLGNTTGSETLFSINNASASAVLVHVVLWSDLSVPVLDFNLYLTGYDVQTIDLRDILVAGNLPRTASAGQDPGDTISPKGQFSQDINFASCNGVLPPPPLPTFFTAHLQAALTGQPSAILAGNCAGQFLGDNIARGYITADTVSDCSLRFPGDTGYFAAGGTGDATDQNVLWGDYMLIRPPTSFLVGGTLVHVEADPTNPATSTAGRYTFYGRYDGWTAVDNREPLATNFGSRFMSGGNNSGMSSLAVWRDSKVNQGPFPCPAIPGLRPPWYWLGQEGIVVFDEQEHPVVPQSFPFSPQPPTGILVPFPAETQLVTVGGFSKLPVPYSFGWLQLDLNTVVAAAGNNPPVDQRAAQAFVTSFDETNGHFAVGIEAVRFDSACSASHPLTCAGSMKPVPIGVTPNNGSQSGGVVVDIHGISFVPGEEQVEFGSSFANAVTFQPSATDLLVIVPPFTGTFPTVPCVGPGGITGAIEVPTTVDVVVIDTFTECGGSLTGGFTYVPLDGSCHVGSPPPPPPPPAASFSVSTLAASLNALFTDTSAWNPTSWSWDFGDTGTSTQENPVHTYALPGTYVVTLLVANPIGSSSVSQSVTVPGTCLGSVTPAPVEVLPDAGFQFGGLPVDIHGASFIPGQDQLEFATTAAAPSPFPASTPTDLQVIVPPFTGIFPTEPCVVAGITGTKALPKSVNVLVIDAATGCTGRLIGGFTYEPSDSMCQITPPPPPQASFSVITSSANDVATFIDTSTGNPTTWFWQFGDASTSVVENPVHTYALPGTYLVTLMVVNLSGSSSASHFLTVPGP